MIDLIETLELKITPAVRRWALSLFPDFRVNQDIYINETREPREFPEIINLIERNKKEMKKEMIRSSKSTLLEYIDGSEDPRQLLAIWISGRDS